MSNLRQRDNDDFYTRIADLKAMIMKDINANKDDRLKSVGDRVKVWDGSANIDKNTQEHRSGVDPLFKDHTAIVIETGCHVVITEQVISDYICDILLKFPNGEEVYVDSSMVKRMDDYKE